MDSGYSRGGGGYGGRGGGSSYSRGGGYGMRGSKGHYGGGSSVPYSNQPYQTTNCKYFYGSLFKVNPEDLVAVKIRGLPYQVRYSEINDFFRQFRYVEKSAILGVGRDGRKNGFGSLLFESPEEAAAAAEELDQGRAGEDRKLELAHAVVVEGNAVGVRHRSRGVEDELATEVGFLLIALHEHLVRTGVELPVEVAGGLAGVVKAVLREFHAEAVKWALVHARDEPLHRLGS